MDGQRTPQERAAALAKLDAHVEPQRAFADAAKLRSELQSRGVWLTGEDIDRAIDGDRR